MRPVAVKQKLSELTAETYQAQKTARAHWRAADEAGAEYASKRSTLGNSTIPRHANETDARYAARTDLTVCPQYVSQIVDRYHGHVMRSGITRAEDGAEQYKRLLIDADGDGTSIEQLISAALRTSLVEGVAYLLADAMHARVYATAADEAADGQRGIIRVIAADSVLWSVRSLTGQPTAALVLMRDDDGRHWLLNIDRQAMQRIELGPDAYAIPGGMTEATAVGPIIAHRYGGCPLVAIRPAVRGGSFAAPIAEQTRLIANLDSWEMQELANCTFTTMVFSGVGADDVKEASLTMGPGKALCLPSTGGSEPKVAAIGGDVAQAASLREKQDRGISNIYRAAGITSGVPNGQQSAAPESGIARAFAFRELESLLYKVSKAAECAENLVIARLASGFGWEAPAPAKWPQVFDAPQLSEDLDYALRMEAGAPAALRAASWRRVAGHLALTESEAESFDEEVQRITTTAGRTPGT